MTLASAAIAPVQTILRLTRDEQDRLRNQFRSLTAREFEVVLVVCQGGSNDDIASRLCVSLPTVRTHLTRAYQKLGADRKSDLVRIVLGALILSYRTTSSDTRSDRPPPDPAPFRR